MSDQATDKHMANIVEQKQKEAKRFVAEALKLPSLPDRAKIIHGRFQDKCKEETLAHLIFTDPSYAEKDLPDYKDLGTAARGYW